MEKMEFEKRSMGKKCCLRVGQSWIWPLPPRSAREEKSTLRDGKFRFAPPPRSRVSHEGEKLGFSEGFLVWNWVFFLRGEWEHWSQCRSIPCDLLSMSIFLKKIVPKHLLSNKQPIILSL